MVDKQLLFERNHKWHEVKSLITIKKKLLEEKPKVCYLCNKLISKNNLQLEHKIPAMLGGDLQYRHSKGKNYDNYELVCGMCHAEKSGIDRSIISMFIKLGLIEKRGWERICRTSPNIIEMFYILCSQKIREQRKRDAEW